MFWLEPYCDDFGVLVTWASLAVLVHLCLSIAILLARMPTGSWEPTTPCCLGSFSGTPVGARH